MQALTYCNYLALSLKRKTARLVIVTRSMGTCMQKLSTLSVSLMNPHARPNNQTNLSNPKTNSADLVRTAFLEDCLRTLV